MDDLSLFGEEPQPPTPAVTQEPLSDAYVTQVREALDALGITGMDERKALIEELAHREVETLRHLRTAEAQIVIQRLRGMAVGTGGTGEGSTWDNRDEDTWIDRM